MAGQYGIGGVLVLLTGTPVFTSITITGLTTLGQRIVMGDIVSNMGIGIDSLLAITTGQYNTALGIATLQNNTIGNNNVAVGSAALNNNISGSTNVAVGMFALLMNTTGFDNVAIGVGALRNNLTGCYCSAIGPNALYNSNNNDNNAFGENGLYLTTTGKWNTAIGYGAGYSNVTGDRGVFMGYCAGYYETLSDKLYIDNAQRINEADGRIKALIYGIFDAASANQRLRINGRLGITHLPNYASDAAAGVGGLISGELYTVTGTDPLQVAAKI